MKSTNQLLGVPPFWDIPMLWWSHDLGFEDLRHGRIPFLAMAGGLWLGLINGDQWWMVISGLMVLVWLIEFEMVWWFCLILFDGWRLFDGFVKENITNHGCVHRNFPSTNSKISGWWISMDRNHYNTSVNEANPIPYTIPNWVSWFHGYNCITHNFLGWCWF